MIDPRLNRFDRLAPYYDVLANLAFGGAISRSHKQNFHLISNGATVLILGGGSGKWLRDIGDPSESNCNKIGSGTTK